MDATLVSAPSSTKNGRRQRDPEMHQARKGQQWHFGAMAHIGADNKVEGVHSVITTATGAADKHMLPDLLDGKEEKMLGDSGYQGQSEAIHEAAPDAQDTTNHRTKFKNYLDEEGKSENRTKSKVRAKADLVSAQR